LDPVGRVPPRHARADNKTGESLYLGHPKFEGFEVIQSERKSSAAA